MTPPGSSSRRHRSARAAFSPSCSRRLDGELPDAVAQHFSTAESNPTIDAAFVLEREQARDPESFAAEYLAQFVGSGAAYLDRDRITDAIAERGELAPDDGVNWVAGLDPAFSSDPFGLAIVGRDPRDRQPARARRRAQLEAEHRASSCRVRGATTGRGSRP